jgi:hypothetical protein
MDESPKRHQEIHLIQFNWDICNGHLRGTSATEICKKHQPGTGSIVRTGQNIASNEASAIALDTSI